MLHVVVNKESIVTDSLFFSQSSPLVSQPVFLPVAKPLTSSLH